MTLDFTPAELNAGEAYGCAYVTAYRESRRHDEEPPALPPCSSRELEAAFVMLASHLSRMYDYTFVNADDVWRDICTRFAALRAEDGT